MIPRRLMRKNDCMRIEIENLNTYLNSTKAIEILKVELAVYAKNAHKEIEQNYTTEVK